VTPTGSDFRIEPIGGGHKLYVGGVYRGTFRTYQQAFEARIKLLPASAPSPTLTKPEPAARRSGGFSPARIPNCELWITTVPLSGSLIPNWPDRSGKGHHLSQPDPARWPALIGNIPAWKGRPIARFDAADDWMAADELAPIFAGIDKPFSLFGVWRLTVSSTATRVVWSFGSTLGAVPVMYMSWATSPTVNYRLVRTDDSTLQVNKVGDAPDLSGHYHSIVFDGITMSAWIDGVMQQNFPFAFDVGQCTFNRFTLGALGRSSTSAFAGIDLGEMAIYSRAVNERERLRMQGYLAKGWSLA